VKARGAAVRKDEANILAVVWVLDWEGGGKMCGRWTVGGGGSGVGLFGVAGGDGKVSRVAARKVRGAFAKH
jgi:hypothetical protein